MAKTRISASVDAALLEQFDQYVVESRSETLEAAMRVFLRSVRDAQVAAYYAGPRDDQVHVDEGALAAASVMALSTLE